MLKPKPSTIKLQVFKGREAKLNKAIFHTLAQKGPQAIYDIHKEVKAQRGLGHTRYASINKRVRFLGESGYINRTGVKKTKAGFESAVYEINAKGYLALLLDMSTLDDLLRQIDEAMALTILADIVSTGTQTRPRSI